MQRKTKIYLLIVLALCALAPLALFYFGAGSPTHSENLQKNFSSDVWKSASKTNFGVRAEMAEPLSTWIIGKSEDDARRLLGEPDWTGVGGVPGLKWQPTDGSIAWNYSLVSSHETSRVSNALRLHVKQGRVITAEIVIIGS
jgi:hypothetical protein